jgi:hypothetical protein
VKTLLDFYAGAYGPTLRIDVQERSGLLVLVRLFDQLATGTAVESMLDANADFELGHCAGARLRCVAKIDRSRVVRSGGEPPFIEWSLSADEWANCVSFTEPLLEMDSPVHQYLVQGNHQLPWVELAYLEGPRRRLTPR